MKFWNNRNALIFTTLLLILFLPLSVVAAQDGDGTQVGIFVDYELLPGSRAEVPVEVRGVENLYAIDIEITFDPEILSIEDADPNIDGIQPALGTFLDAGLTLFNTVDNEAGVIRFVMSQMNPSESKSGDGIILILYFQGLAEGVSNLEVTILELSTRSGEAISAEPVSAQLSVSDEVAAKQSTSIPVQDPTSMIHVPTSAPPDAQVNITPTWTLNSTVEESGDEPVDSIASEETSEISEEAHLSDTATPIILSETGSEDEMQSAVDGDSTTDDQSNFSLMEHWWIVAVVVVVAVGLGLCLWLTRK